MADIEERAEAWVKANYSAEYLAHQDEGFAQALAEAYLAGASQAQQDYLDWAKSKGWL